MKQKKTEPFAPVVTTAQMAAFDPERQETFTASPLMNAVLAAMKREKFTQLADVARYLEVSAAHLAGAIRIITGMTFNQMRDQWFRLAVQLLEEEHPEWDKTQIAEALGYSDHTALWRLFHRDYDHRYYKGWHDKVMARQAERDRIALMMRWEKYRNGGQG